MDSDSIYGERAERGLHASPGKENSRYSGKLGRGGDEGRGGEGGGGGGGGGTATFASFVNSARQLTPRQLYVCYEEVSCG